MKKWKILRTVSKGDYTYAVVPDHPNRTKNNYVLEHRVIMENELGRLLTSDEVVHHKNEKKKDNRLSNLKLLTVGEHERLHALKKGRKYVDLLCPNCCEVFSKPHNNTHLCKKSNWTACSPKCRGSFSKRIQLDGKLTKESQKRVEENVVREYIKFDN